MKFSSTLFLIIAVAVISALFFLYGCESNDDQSDNVPDPRMTAEKLLELHGLLGRQPEDRTDEEKNKIVDPKAVKALLWDFDMQDQFTTDIYVGFIVGALARNQSKYFATVTGKRGTIYAGKALIKLNFVHGNWLIDVNDSVPEEIRMRAAEEKKIFEEAKKKSTNLY